MTANNQASLFAVVTTIQAPTHAMRLLSERLVRCGAQLVVIGDRKGPESFELEASQFHSLEAQRALPFALAEACPVGHYTRKNIGYLEAIRRGASCIYETDDDNAPLEAWSPRDQIALACEATSRGWVNAYRHFTQGRIWPRGFPLDDIAGSCASQVAPVRAQQAVKSPIQQGLANGSPDVDAIWRLALDAPFDFESAPSLLLPPGAWCPFNSQSTWWWPDAFPLLYLPSYCSFRMTDIWRSFVAQRCLWELGYGVVFHAAEVVQDRNQHDLMRDFADEVPGYLHNRRIAQVLEVLELKPGVESVVANLRCCYEALVAAEIFPAKELDLLAVWLRDIESL